MLYLIVTTVLSILVVAGGIVLTNRRELDRAEILRRMSEYLSE